MHPALFITIEGESHHSSYLADQICRQLPASRVRVSDFSFSRKMTRDEKIHQLSRYVSGLDLPVIYRLDHFLSTPLEAIALAGARPVCHIFVGPDSEWPDKPGYCIDPEGQSPPEVLETALVAIRFALSAAPTPSFA